MEIPNEKVINFLQKPKINADKLKYIHNTKDVYANLYEIKIKKKLQLFQNPFTVTPSIEAGDIRIRDKLFKTVSRKFRSIYGDCFISGDSLYSMKEISEVKIVECSLHLKGRTDYEIRIQGCENARIIKQEDIQKDPLSKQFIEMIIRDILRANPKLEFYKDLFVLTNKKKKIETERVSISFYPGFTTSFMETEKGNYLNVTLKNKIIQNDTVLGYINQYKNLNDSETQEDIRENLKPRSFKVSYAKRNYKIDDICFDKNPKNTTINYEGKTINLIQYYEQAHKLTINNPNQPLILVRRKDSQGEPLNLYFVPEFCFLAGLEDQEAKDGFFMKELAKFTKLETTDRVDKTNEFINLLNDPEKNEEHPQLLSSKEKCELYGIEVMPVKDLFKAYYMKDTELEGAKGTVHSNDRTFRVLKKKIWQIGFAFMRKIIIMMQKIFIIPYLKLQKHLD